MNPRLAIAIVCLAIAGYILAFFCEDAFGADFVDSSSAMHFGASAGIGFMTGVATQNIDNPWVRRTAAVSVCMIPGVAKELGDPTVSDEDLFWDLSGCFVGLALFEGLNVMIGKDSVSISGSF